MSHWETSIHVSEGELAMLLDQFQLLHSVHQTLDVSHSEQCADARLRFKWLKVIHAFSCSNEVDAQQTGL